MEKNKDVGVRINATISTIDRNSGKILETETLHNIVVDGGLERIAKRLISDLDKPYNYIAIGTGLTTAYAADLMLESEVTRAFSGMTYIVPAKMQFNKVFVFGSGEVYNITEAGIFDDPTASGSTMFNRLVFAAKAVDIDTSLSVTITITVGRV